MGNRGGGMPIRQKNVVKGQITRKIWNIVRIKCENISARLRIKIVDEI